MSSAIAIKSHTFGAHACHAHHYLRGCISSLVPARHPSVHHQSFPDTDVIHSRTEDVDRFNLNHYSSSPMSFLRYLMNIKPTLYAFNIFVVTLSCIHEWNQTLVITPKNSKIEWLSSNISRTATLR